MKKIVIMYTANKNDPKNTWSGTSYSLMQAISKIVDIEFINLKEDWVIRLLKKLDIYCCKTKKLRKLAMIFGGLHDYLIRKKADFLIRKNKENPILEIANDVKLKHNNYYIYQDLSIAVVKKVRDNMGTKDRILGGGFREEYLESEIKRQIEIQKKEYYSAKKVFFMGKWVANEMKEMYPEIKNKFIPVGGGLNKEFLDLKVIYPRENNIVFIGIDYKRKSLEIVIKAFKKMKEEKKLEAELYVIGPNKDEIREVNSSIHILGKMPRKEISEYLSRAKIFCMPSKFEAYGLVFPEALTYGTPCIGISKYEMPYFIENGKNGILIQNYDENELASAMYELLNNDEILKYTIKKRNEYKKIYSWDEVAKKIVKEIFNND